MAYVFTLSLRSRYWLMGVMTGRSLVAVLSLNYVFFGSAGIGATMRSLIMSLIYDKALWLPSESRQEYTTGENLTLMSVDTERVLNYVAHGVWPVMGSLGFAIVLGSSACSSTAILQLRHIDRIDKLQKQLLKVIDERVKVTFEALRGIAVMKVYALEDSLAHRVDKLHVREVALLRMIHLYEVVNTVMIFATPTYLSGVTFGLYMLIRHNITFVQAYALIAMVNNCRTTLTQLSQAIAGYSNAKFVRFIVADEVATQFFLPSTSATRLMTTPLISEPQAEDEIVGKGCLSIRDANFLWPCQVRIPRHPYQSLAILEDVFISVFGFRFGALTLARI
ncbi:Multidrug resistance protein ABC transporter [Phytophthora megakarya]|uniref:Multidrug resistance protein ABC transporter n=1 Tax=Phytophthora megakarya TaxID=4795 RepID=A0A225VQW6_9STRA|nr:Multidrug resistance protein ABC transporter [Phytophthora megakarya]